ncbi:MAG TPA: transposase [Dokdonella sp.]|uniref:transposase n=1 Tax=Dokdonella sp. TaxID=2291710 RepID=UPI002D80D315|nr:transposase [Dokdonella sp.]HET9033214.1 transposase [Dokdonella sp.]
MARPVRIEFGGALYHVTARGDRRETIFEDDGDRERFLELLGEVVSTFNWLCHAYCLMGNHYHLIIGTPDGNLSKGMRQLNGVFTQWSNRRHRRTGHLFQGRFKAILVDADSYLLELTRYVALNPVRAGMVGDPGEWPWSSYSAMVGAADSPEWLETDGLLAQFGSRRASALRAFQRFVYAGVGADSPWKHLNRQVFLGNDAFVERMQKRATGRPDDLSIPKVQRRPPPPTLAALAKKHPNRNEAIRAAWATGEYSYAQIGKHFGLFFTTIGRIVRSGTPRR